MPHTESFALMDEQTAAADPASGRSLGGAPASPQIARRQPESDAALTGSGGETRSAPLS